MGPAADALGVDDEDLGVGGQHVDQELEVVDQHRGQRLHALDRDAGGHLGGHLGQLGVALAQGGRATAYVVGEQELTARRRPQPLGLVDGALVGDREGADLLDLVAPELHPDRVLLGRREHVDQPAADRELAALLDQVDPGVRRVGQAPGHVVEVGGLADDQLDRLEVAEALHLRLEDRAHRCDHDPERPGVGVDARMTQPAEHRQPAADGVAARAQPLVRQGLPAREVRHRPTGRPARRSPPSGPPPRGRWR